MITRIDAYAYRHAIERPVATSFGIMTNRPAVFVRLEDSEGAFGWGEIFANWPAAGAEHRVRLLMEDIADLVLGATLREPADLYRKLTKETHIRALQCGEWGPFRQVIAGLDIAAWDLAARRAGVPVRALLGDSGGAHVPAYASGIHIRHAGEAISTARGLGFTAFKVKVGFGLERDAADVNALAAGLLPGERLFTDANQAWDVADAARFAALVGGAGIGWLEEPIAADAPAEHWQRLARDCPVPLAAGENITGVDAFKAAIDGGALTVIQPDVAKWGGLTDCATVARAAIGAGRMYCPHFLGGGIGLLASAHLLAAVGGDGLLEVDVNPNPLRDELAPVASTMQEGMWQVGEAPGLGIETLPNSFAAMQTLHRSRRA